MRFGETTTLALALTLTLAAGLAACEARRAVSDGAGAAHSQRGEPPADTSANLGTSTHLAHTGVPDAAATTIDSDRHDAGGAAIASDIDGDQPLLGEERERDPRSDTVKIKVFVDPRRQAHVFWGRKDYGPAPLEIERPRNSGPLDLVVVAPGYLPHHARAFTDRDDAVSLRLYAAVEAPQLLGYRSDVAHAPATQKSPEK